MNILIVGYGRMGREVEQAALQRGHTVAGRVDPSGSGDALELTTDLLKASDAVIEFSLPEGIEENSRLYCQTGTPAVIGTTGWAQKKESIEQMVGEAGSGYLYGSNFSIGAHLFFHLTETVTRLINPFPDYDIMVTEYHHRFKKDSPSGTALTTAQRIVENSNRKKRIQPEKLDRQIEDDELHVASVRGGQIPGTHSVLVDSLPDSIQITHTARNRSGFAIGSVIAAEWLKGRNGFFTVDEFINDIFKGEA